MRIIISHNCSILLWNWRHSWWCSTQVLWCSSMEALKEINNSIFNWVLECPFNKNQKAYTVSQQTRGIKQNTEQLSGHWGHSLISALFCDSATLLHIYSHPCSLCWSGTAVCRASWWARSGNRPRLTKNNLVGKKKVTLVSSPVLPTVFKELYQHNRGRRGWKKGRETGLLEQMLQLRCSPAKPRMRQWWWERGWKGVMIQT